MSPLGGEKRIKWGKSGLVSVPSIESRNVGSFKWVGDGGDGKGADSAMGEKNPHVNCVPSGLKYSQRCRRESKLCGRVP